MRCVRKKDVFALTIDGKTKKYPITHLPPAFVAWNLGQRLGFLDHMRDPSGHPMRGSGFGAHLPIYVTQNKKSALFPANAAVKGSGFVAKEKYLAYYIKKFRAVIEESKVIGEKSEAGMIRARQMRMEAITEFYRDRGKIDLRCMAGLEIWPGVTTRNFRNDPRVSVHFLGMPGREKSPRYHQWQINCMWEEITHGDPRFEFGRTLRELTLGKIGKSFVPGHIPVENTPIKGKYPSGWILWVIEARDKGLDMAGI